jgi:hypothetical protein
MVSALYNGLTSSTIFHLETTLKSYIDEVQAGKRDATSVSSLDQLSSNDSGWAQIIKDLEEMDASKTVVNENAITIMERLLKAINGGQLSLVTTSHIYNREVPILITLMGATGEGKSSFVRTANY